MFDANYLSTFHRRQQELEAQAHDYRQARIVRRARATRAHRGRRR